MSLFTPGPWRLVNERHKTHQLLITVASDSVTICKVSKDPKISPEEEAANARLLAAAPEIYEQLLLAREYLRSEKIYWSGIELIVAKVEGEE